MATKRDLVEAHQFSRRRLITAFVSGAPGGREVEPARPGRALVGGLALALLVVAGGAVTGLIFGRDEADWKQPGLVISKDRGQAYVISTPDDDELVIRPVINITSARLILGSDAEPTYVSEQAINAEKIGEPIGILNAPANVPDEDDLVESGWTACTSAESGLRLTLARRPGVAPAPGAGFLVESRGVRYVIAQSGLPSQSGGGEQPSAYAYALPSDPGAQDNLLRDLGLSVGADATKVTTEWLALWPVGGALVWETFGISGAGEPRAVRRRLVRPPAPGPRRRHRDHARRERGARRGGPAAARRLRAGRAAQRLDRRTAGARARGRAHRRGPALARPQRPLARGHADAGARRVLRRAGRRRGPGAGGRRSESGRRRPPPRSRSRPVSAPSRSLPVAAPTCCPGAGPTATTGRRTSSTATA